MYSSNAGNCLFFEGMYAMEAFSFNQGDVLTILVDQNTKNIEWYLQG